MNCSMALEASELERNKVFGSAMKAKNKGVSGIKQRIFCIFALYSALLRKNVLKKGQPEPPAQ